MKLFFLSFIAIYGGMHLYAFLKARAAFAFGNAVVVPLVFLLILMCFTPMTVRMMESFGYETPARVMAFTGYIWMSVLLLFFSVGLATDLYRLLLYLGGLLSRRDLSVLAPGAKALFLVPLFLSLVLTAYGYLEARDIRTERVIVKTAKLPPGIDKLTVVQISDMHIGLIVRGIRLAEMLDEVKNTKPDILVSTGDLVDGQLNNLNGVSEMFKGINPPYGKFAILGNHEFYAGLGQSLDFMQQSGFRLLRGDAVSGLINIAGVDDDVLFTSWLQKGPNEMELLKGLHKDRFTLLLKHRPVINPDSLGLFDLQLSGHAHKGQIFPFSLIVKLRFPYLSGFFNLGQGSSLYVSRGTGTWGPPVRLMARPEVTVIEITRG
jgi:hypothetical protein